MLHRLSGSTLSAAAIVLLNKGHARLRSHRNTAMFMLVAFVLLVVAIVGGIRKVMCTSTREAIKRLAIRRSKLVHVDMF